MAKMNQTNESLYAIDWWKMRHDAVYFPDMEQHKDWKIYEDLFPWIAKLADPKPDDVCLEIGCGYGQWMIPMSRRVKSVDGFDIHGSLVSKAAEKFAEHGVSDRCSMRLGDGLTIPFSGPYTLIYSISVFQHIPRATVMSYFRESDRVLASGGRVMFHFRNDDGVGVYSKDIRVNHDGDWSVGWSSKDVADAALSVGWTPTQIDLGQSLVLVAEKRGKASL